MPKRKRLIFVLGGIVFLAILLLVAFIRGKYALPILMYHSINPQAVAGKMLTVSPDTFERQMRFLKNRHYNVVPLAAMIDFMKDKRRILPNTVVITLDDGYKDNYTYAFPILKKYNLPATIFIIINEVGRNDRLSWEEIRQMRDSGLITFGSHTLGPEPLINIKSEAEVKRQIFDSKRILENKLGSQALLFSYPEGRFDGRIRQWVIDAGYKLAVTTNPGKRFADDDVFALKRLRISENCRNLLVFGIETSGYYNFIREQRRKR